MTTTTVTTGTARFRYIGTTSDVVQCENCGKPDLRATVIIVPVDAEGNDEGEPCYYGSVCAAKALAVRGGGAAVRKAAEGARLNTLMAAHDAVRMLRFYGLPLTGEVEHDALRFAVRVYVRQHSGLADRVARTGVKVPEMVRDMLARKRAAIAEAVLVAGPDWAADPQPLDYGWRREIERCQRQARADAA
jgi:hypothetical protein